MNDRLQIKFALLKSGDFIGFFFILKALLPLTSTSWQGILVVITALAPLVFVTDMEKKTEKALAKAPRKRYIDYLGRFYQAHKRYIAEIRDKHSPHWSAFTQDRRNWSKHTARKTNIHLLAIQLLNMLEMQELIDNSNPKNYRP